MILFTALMLWKGLMFFKKSENLSVVVLFGSMEPALLLGNTIFVDNQIHRFMLEILRSLKFRAGIFLSFMGYVI